MLRLSSFWTFILACDLALWTAQLFIFISLFLIYFKKKIREELKIDKPRLYNSVIFSTEKLSGT